MIIDKSNDSFIMCDQGNRWVVEWTSNHLEDCLLLPIYGWQGGSLYLRLWEKLAYLYLRWPKSVNLCVGISQSSRKKMVAMEGIVVVDNNNHRIMRQSKGSTEGSVVVVIEGTEEDSPEFP